MISDRTLELALERAVVTSDQVAALRSIERDIAGAASPDQKPVDDETLRFVTGFGDIFVTIGVVLFLGALSFLMDAGAGSTPMFAGLAAAAWLLAEFFTGRRRMALPSIVLLVAFVGAVLMVTLQIFTALLPGSSTLPGRFWFTVAPNDFALIFAAIATIAMAAMHYIRFHVPITIAAGAAVLGLLVIGLVAIVVPSVNETGFNVVLLLCGLAVFMLAMRFDMSDPERATRRTDIAFWLHLLAAPLIVHPLVTGFIHGLDTHLTTGAAVGILWIFLLLGIVAVVIDRRAILVSGLVYAGVAFGTLIKTLGFSNSSLLLPTVLLVLGGFILLLSAGWLPLRRAILRRLPSALARRLPHSLVPSTT